MVETQDTQIQLLGRIAEGDPQALADFYDQTAAPLFSLALRIVGEAGEAEEVIQDAFVQIWEKAKVFDPLLGSAFHWALSITRHRALDRLRSRQRRARLIDQLEQTGAGDPQPPGAPDSCALGQEEASGVHSALESLPKEQQQAIKMAFFKGLTHAEIAEALRVPLGTVKARIRRGLLKLRESFKSNHDY